MEETRRYFILISFYVGILLWYLSILSQYMCSSFENNYFNLPHISSSALLHSYHRLNTPWGKEEATFLLLQFSTTIRKNVLLITALNISTQLTVYEIIELCIRLVASPFKALLLLSIKQEITIIPKAHSFWDTWMKWGM